MLEHDWNDPAWWYGEGAKPGGNKPGRGYDLFIADAAVLAAPEKMAENAVGLRLGTGDEGLEDVHGALRSPPIRLPISNRPLNIARSIV
jgi:hypothetical protein